MVSLTVMIRLAIGHAPAKRSTLCAWRMTNAALAFAATEENGTAGLVPS